VEQGLQSASNAREAPGWRQDSTEIIGQAPAMQELFRAIGRLAQSHATVLITGESGSGKELVAQALHRHSPRAKGPFVSLSTSAVPKDLLESELFGHERGAFPGAQTLRRGRLEQADGGTLFLGEIGDLPFDLQTRLLRVLTDGHFYRIGGQDPIKANVRIIASTHQNLEQRVAAGLFREDLMHRLNVIRLRMPSLRERSEDIPALAKHFMLICAKSLGVEPKKLSDEVLKEMTAMAFPGNVRQLENLCHWLTVMTPANVVGVGDLPADTISQLSDQPTLVQGESSPSSHGASTKMVTGDWESGLSRLAVKMLQDGDAAVFDALNSRFEKAVLQAALEVTRGRRVEAAQRLGIGRNTITRKLQELGIDD
jgi:two-component system, NtrC family, nitrogen regulation response regulator GlnG